MKLLPNSYPGVYELQCSCQLRYLGETKKKILSRVIEHQQHSLKRIWESSGATEHTLECHGNFKWFYSKTIARETNCRQIKIRETLETIKATLDEKMKLLNSDEGNLASRNTWTPLFVKMIRTDVAQQRNQDTSEVK